MITPKPVYTEIMLALQKQRQSLKAEEELDRIRNLGREIVGAGDEIGRNAYQLYRLIEEEIGIVEGKQ